MTTGKLRDLHIAGQIETREMIGEVNPQVRCQRAPIELFGGPDCAGVSLHEDT